MVVLFKGIYDTCSLFTSQSITVHANDYAYSYLIKAESVTSYEMSAIRNPCKDIEAEMRWPKFYRQLFQMYFLD